MSEAENQPTPETEEVDVSEIFERIEALEKENSDQKEKIAALETRIADCEISIDAVAQILDH